LAVWHRPLFSSGDHGNQAAVRPLADLLYEAGAEIIVNGHDHIYERFAPSRPDGMPDPRRGTRQFIVGTGGAALYELESRVAHSEVVQNSSWGVLKLRLRDRSYRWRFLPVAGTFADAGEGVCHGRPDLAAVVEDPLVRTPSPSRARAAAS
jgi:hypothetical protein